ncbi:MAG: cysteine desulfurase [Bacteroidetes bacterium]|nr:MAG: cysteine desulfurase [Bacteroidota bacterium]
MKVYLDNAATTALDKEVLEAMLPYMQEHFGNPSSIHSFGRKTRAAIESARKIIAKNLNVSPSEIFFTSGGTEAINTAIRCTIRDLGIKHAITSKIEHHAVLHTLEALEHAREIKLSYVDLDSKGHVDLNHLEELLNAVSSQNAEEPVTRNLKPETFVSLMHANNEIGNLLPMKRAGELCGKYKAVFHSDTTQTMAHYKMDLKSFQVDMVNGAAHKFHGPKGVGFLYLSGSVKINPFIYGGSQERNMRGGTENLYGIVGLGKAFEVALRDMDAHHAHIQGLKSYMIEQLKNNIPGISFNGDAEGSSLYTLLNVQFPFTENAEMMLFNLDIAGIAASGGSACTSGSNQGSHVLKGIGSTMSRPSVRFSFSKYNTKEDIDFCVSKLKEFFLVKV